MLPIWSLQKLLKLICITCDDKLCKKCRALGLAIWAGNPVAFCDKEGLR